MNREAGDARPTAVEPEALLTAVRWAWENALAHARRLAVEPDGLPLDVPFTPWLALAIDDHALAYPASDSLHYDGMCSSDCAADIAARYRIEAARHARLTPTPAPPEARE